jgi:hypothetical protein
MEDMREVLCGANSYEQKYYFNQKFNKLPKSIQEELHIICVLFTEDVGGVFTMVFNEDGTLMLETIADDSDYLYDEINAGLMVRKVQDSRQELFESISLYYRAMNGELSVDDLET